MKVKALGEIHVRGTVAAGVVGLSLLVASTTASAEIRILTFEGTVSSGIDGANEFGLAGGSLYNMPYVQNFTYDTTKGVHLSLLTGDELFGGPTSFLQSPILSSTITINGITRELGGDNNADLLFGYIAYFMGPIGITVTTGHSEFTPDGAIYTMQKAGIILDSPPTPSLTNVFSTPLSGTVYSPNSRFTMNYSANDGSFMQSSGDLNPTSVMISALPPSGDPGQGSGSGGPETAGVPEPASWAMLVAGFGLAGSALRRRRTPSARIA